MIVFKTQFIDDDQRQNSQAHSFHGATFLHSSKKYEWNEGFGHFNRSKVKSRQSLLSQKIMVIFVHFEIVSS